MAYDWDVFISYNREENAPDAWIEKFKDKLNEYLGFFLNRKARTFYDAAEIKGSADFNDTIIPALEKTAVLLPILTGGYFQKYWCLREFSTFIEKNETKIKVEQFWRVYKIESTKLDADEALATMGANIDESNPDKLMSKTELLGCLGKYNDVIKHIITATLNDELFEQDVNKKTEPIDIGNEKTTKKIQNIAEEVGRLLGKIYKPDPNNQRPCVCLLGITSDVSSETFELKMELDKGGVDVFWKTAGGNAAAIEAENKVLLNIVLVGAKPISGSGQVLGRLATGKPTLYWISAGLKQGWEEKNKAGGSGKTDNGQRDISEYLKENIAGFKVGEWDDLNQDDLQQFKHDLIEKVDLQKSKINNVNQPGNSAKQ